MIHARNGDIPTTIARHRVQGRIETFLQYVERRAGKRKVFPGRILKAGHQRQQRATRANAPAGTAARSVRDRRGARRRRRDGLLVRGLCGGCRRRSLRLRRRGERSALRRGPDAHQYAILSRPIDSVGPVEVEHHQAHRGLRHHDDLLCAAAIFDLVELLLARPRVETDQGRRTELERAAAEQNLAEAPLGERLKRGERIR
jgi:hypothetical protein